jgi:hypothetical protein
MPPTPEDAYPAYSYLSGTGSLLIDRSHLENFDVSGFTNFLQSEGWVIAYQTTIPITFDALAPFDVVMIPTNSGPIGVVTPFVSSELDAFQEYVDQGGAVWIFHDGGVDRSPSGVNTLGAIFGSTFQADVLRDSTNNEGSLVWPTIHLLTTHPTTQDVTSYGYYGGTCLTVTTPSIVVASGDNDTYGFTTCSSFPVVMSAFDNGGRGVFSGDITPLHPSYYPSNLRAEEQLLLQNIANWLLGPPPSAVQSHTWGSIKSRHR